MIKNFNVIIQAEKNILWDRYAYAVLAQASETRLAENDRYLNIEYS